MRAAGRPRLVSKRLAAALIAAAVLGVAAPVSAREPAEPERWIDIDRTHAEVRLMEGSDVVATFPAAVSKDQSDDGFWATAVGTYAVYEKDESLHYTEVGDAWISHWVGFDPDRFNGFHSFPKDERGLVVDDRFGPVSLGCVRLPDEHARRLFEFATIGMRVRVRW